MDISFLNKPVGSTIDEMLDFCHKALELLESWKNKIDENPLI